MNCEICGKPKKKISRQEFNAVLKEMGKTWEQLDPITQDVFRLSKWTYTCDCPEKKAWLIDKLRNKE